MDMISTPSYTMSASGLLSATGVLEKDMYRDMSYKEPSGILHHHHNRHHHHDEELISVPWDNDNFSLCLDTFPASRFTRNKSNRYPLTVSPLRKQWGSSPSSISNGDSNSYEDVSDMPLPGIEEDKEFITSITPPPPPMASSTNQQRDIMFPPRSSSFKNQQHVHKRDIVAGGGFPYNNNGNFLDGADFSRKSSRTHTNKSSPTGTVVEVISPLSNSAILLKDRQDSLHRYHPSPKQHTVNMSNISSSVVSFPEKDYFDCNTSQMLDSQFSDSVESWRVTRAKQRSNTSPIVGPLIGSDKYEESQSSPMMARQPAPSQSRSYTPHTLYDNGSSSSMHRIDVYGSSPSPLHQRHHGNYNRHNHHYRHPEKAPLQRYNSSLGSPTCYYTPQESLAASMMEREESVRSYHSHAVPNNADNLVFYSCTASVCDTAGAYSQKFEPTVNSNLENGSTHRGKRASAKLFSKLLRNIRIHLLFKQSTTLKA